MEPMGANHGHLEENQQMEKTNFTNQRSHSITNNIRSYLDTLQPSLVTFHNPPSLPAQPNTIIQHGRFGWHAGMSQHPYTLCVLTPIVKTCYGCGEGFIKRYRIPPCNIIVKHAHRRIRGGQMNKLGNFCSVPISSRYNMPVGVIVPVYIEFTTCSLTVVISTRAASRGLK